MELNNQMKKSVELMENSMGQYLDMCLLYLDNYTEQREKIDNAVRKYMDRFASEQEKSAKYFEEMVSQTKKNQQQYQSFMKEAVNSMVGNAHKFIPTHNYGK